MKFKNDAQKFDYVKEKEKELEKELRARAKRERINDEDKLEDLVIQATGQLVAEAVYDDDFPVEQRNFTSTQKIDKYFYGKFKNQTDVVWRNHFS